MTKRNISRFLSAQSRCFALLRARPLTCAVGRMLGAAAPTREVRVRSSVFPRPLSHLVQAEHLCAQEGL